MRILVVLLALMAGPKASACDMSDNSGLAALIGGIADSESGCRNRGGPVSVWISAPLEVNLRTQYEKFYSVTCLDESTYLGKIVFDKGSCEMVSSSFLSGTQLR